MFHCNVFVFRNFYFLYSPITLLWTSQIAYILIPLLIFSKIHISNLDDNLREFRVRMTLRFSNKWHEYKKVIEKRCSSGINRKIKNMHTKIHFRSLKYAKERIAKELKICPKNFWKCSNNGKFAIKYQKYALKYERIH